MSDSDDSMVIYTEVVLHAPHSPDYVPGPEEPEQAPPSPDFVPEHAYLEFMPLEDEFDPEEEPEEDDEDPEEDPADYPADGGNDGDDEDESSNDDEDEDVDIEGDEEEEHLARADSTAVALPAVDQAPYAEEMEPFETDESAATPPPHPVYHVTTRISIRPQSSISLPFREEVERLLALPSPPPSPLSPLSSPLPQIPSPPLPVSSLVPVLSLSPPASPIHPLGYRAVMIRLRVEAASTSHLLPLPPPIILSHTRPNAPSSGTPPLHLLSTNCRADRPEIGESSSAPTARPPKDFRADYGFFAIINREIMWDLERDIGYGITDTWDEILVDMPGELATDDTEMGRQMIEFTTRVRQDTYEIYTRLDDEQSERQLMAGRLNMLYRDRRAHTRTTRLMEAEARMSREAWGRSMDASDLAPTEVMSLRTQVVAQQAVIIELQAADRRRQKAVTEMLAADRRRQAQFIEALKLLKRLQNQMT
ncbi:hypothetical protein Tco_1117066, partial [Tanacetum coccineum]